MSTMGSVPLPRRPHASWLNDLCRQGKLAPFTWGKTRLYHRTQLDAFVLQELDQVLSATEAEGNPPLS